MRIESMSQVFVDNICLIDSSFRNRGLCHSCSSFYRSIVDYRLNNHRRGLDSAALQLWWVCKKQKDPSQQSWSSSPINSTFKLSSGSRQYKLSLHPTENRLTRRSYSASPTRDSVLQRYSTWNRWLSINCYPKGTLIRIPLLTTAWNYYARLSYINELILAELNRSWFHLRVFFVFTAIDTIILWQCHNWANWTSIAIRSSITLEC